MIYDMKNFTGAATSGLSFFRSFHLTCRGYTRNADLRAGSTHLPTDRTAASLNCSSGSSPGAFGSAISCNNQIQSLAVREHSRYIS